ncbi:MAG: hypothetical protein EOO11_17735, partial [Chitinophagaceae bacterium]
MSSFRIPGKPSRIRTLLIGLLAGVVYAFLAMLIINHQYQVVSVTYIFMLPLALGAIPVLFSTREQLQSYKSLLLLPWGITMSFFVLCFVSGFEGLICLLVIIGPFVLLGSLAAFLSRLAALRMLRKKTPLYAVLLLPFLAMCIEPVFAPATEYGTVRTSVIVQAPAAVVWENVKNVRDIRRSELKRHFVHLIGVPRPLDGALDREGVGGVRHITWEKGIRFRETITQWDEGRGFSYRINVDPASIPPGTLDEHVLIGGRYFDVTEGGYSLEPLGPGRCRLTLRCTYR